MLKSFILVLMTDFASQLILKNNLVLSEAKEWHFSMGIPVMIHDPWPFSLYRQSIVLNSSQLILKGIPFMLRENETSHSKKLIQHNSTLSSLAATDSSLL